LPLRASRESTGPWRIASIPPTSALSHVRLA
jgi:hypothetical protein